MQNTAPHRPTVVVNPTPGIEIGADSTAFPNNAATIKTVCEINCTSCESRNRLTGNTPVYVLDTVSTTNIARPMSNTETVVNRAALVANPTPKISHTITGYTHIASASQP